MRLALIVEGRTDKVFLPHLRKFLSGRLPNKMPRIDPLTYDGRVPTHEKLKRTVDRLLNGKFPADHVIALTDVYTGSNPPEFVNANDARIKMREWAGNEARFHPHAAQYDFEAWLLPYWPTIQKLAKHNRVRPPGKPEDVNHGRPPAYRLNEIFELGGCRHSYIKPRDADRILRENDLMTSVMECPELRALVNTILSICGGELV